MPRQSIAIAGAGPAGLSAALLLERDGHQVTIVERFATPQPLGSGLMLQPTGLAVLAELGLADRVLGLGRRIDRLFGRVAPSNRIVLDVRYRVLGASYFGLAVHRAALFDPLFKAARQSRIAIDTGRAIEGLDRAADRRPILLVDGRRLGPFDLVVDAMGMRSPLASHYKAVRRRELSYGALWSSVPWPHGYFDDHALEQRYWSASTMVGVLPIGRRSPSDHEEPPSSGASKPPITRSGKNPGWKHGKNAFGRSGRRPRHCWRHHASRSDDTRTLHSPHLAPSGR